MSSLTPCGNLRLPGPHTNRSYPSGNVACVVCKKDAGLVITVMSDHAGTSGKVWLVAVEGGAGCRGAPWQEGEKRVDYWTAAARAGSRCNRPLMSTAVWRQAGGRRGGAGCLPSHPPHLGLPPTANHPTPTDDDACRAVQVLASFDNLGLGGVNYPNGKPWCVSKRGVLGPRGSGVGEGCV